MALTERKSAIIDMAMRLIAENGLANFAMKQISTRLHINEALIYRDFSTRENLLTMCMSSYEKDMHTMLNTIDVASVHDMDSFLRVFKDGWNSFVSFLITEDYRTIFYVEYATTPTNRGSKENQRSPLAFINRELSEVCTIETMEESPEPGKTLIDYVLFGMTLTYVKGVILDGYKDSEVARDMLWDLLLHSLSHIITIKFYEDEQG